MEQSNDKRNIDNLRLELEQLLTGDLPVGDDIQLVDVIPIDHLQTLQDKFSQANGVTSIILDVNGNPITTLSNSSKFCRSTYFKGVKCATSEKLKDKTITAQKHCRLMEADSPLHIYGRHVATWKIGMCGMGRIITPFIEAACETVEKFDEIYEKLSGDVRGHFEDVCDLLKTAAEEISELGYTNIVQERKLALLKEQDIKLAENEESLRSIFDNSIDGIVLIGEDGDVKEWNTGVEQMTGIPKDEAIGKKIWDLKYMSLSLNEYDEKQKIEMCEQLKDIILNKEQVNFTRKIINLNSRKEIIIHAVYFPMSIHGDLKIGSIMRDVTKELANERELHLEKERLQSLNNSLPGGALYQFTLNTQTQEKRLSYVSAQWEDVTGIPNNVAIDDINNLFWAIHIDDIQTLLQLIEESAQNMSKFNCEIRFVHNNEVRWAQMNSHPHLDGDLIIWNGLILDITERKNNELQLTEYRDKLELQVKERTEQYEAINEEMHATNEELYATNEELYHKNSQLSDEMNARRELMQKLEESESKMRNFIEQSFEGIVISDNDGKVIEWNAAQEQISGVSSEEAIGKYCWELFKQIIGDDQAVNSYRKRVFSYLASDNDDCQAVESEYTIHLSDFDIRYVTIASFRIAMADKCFMGEIVRDTTERKLIELELQQYQSMLEEMVENQTRKLVESKERLTSLSNNLPGGVIFQLSDKNTLVPQFTYISAHFEEMFQVAIDDVVEDTSVFFRLLHPEDGAKLIDLITSSEQSQLVDVECRVMLDTGQSKWIHLRWSYHNLEDGTHVWDGFIIDVTDKKAAELELEETRFRQNTLIKVLQLLQSSEDQHTAISQALAEAGRYANVSRSYIFEISPDGKTVDNTYEWCNEGINPEIDNLQGVPKEIMKTWFDAFEQNEYVCASDISKMEPEVYEALKQQDIKSILVIPLTANGVVYGFVGFDECVNYKEWRQNDVDLIISLSQIISTATRRHLAEKAIKLSQQTMHTVLDNINASIYVADFETCELLFVNKTLKDMMGGDLEGNYCYTVLHGKTEPCEFCPKPKLLDAQNRPTGIYRWEEYNTKLGKWFECSDAAIEWVDGRIVHMEYATDITDRRSAEEAVRRSEEMYRQLTAASPDAIVVCNPQGKIIYVSPRAKELFLINDESEIVEIPFNHYVHPHDMRKSSEMFKSLVGGVVSVQPQLLLMREDGSEFFGEVSSASVMDDENNITSIIMVIRDITERKISEMELIRAKEKAEESDKLKSAFLANMSHEIRTPINGINGFLSFIADENLSPKRRSEYIAVVQNSSAQLVRIIDDIIDIAKIEAQQLTIRPMVFQLNDFMRELHTFFETYLQTNKKTKVALVLDDSQFIDHCQILSDPTRLRQVITNLIGNASKFTEKGYISFGYRQLSPGKLEFWVEDTGIGLPPGQLEVIFERFRQVELSNHRKYGGTGLGLTISRSLVQMMGGNISVESVEGDGSTFKFIISYLPIAPADEHVFAEIRPEKPLEERYFPEASILLVDPEVINSKYYEKILTYNGASITIVQNVTQWIEAVNQQKHIDLVLINARVFKNEDEMAFRDIRSVRSGLPVMLIVPELNEFYNYVIKNMQSTRVVEGIPDYQTLCEEIMRVI